MPRCRSFGRRVIKLIGHTGGLKATHLDRLLRLYRRRVAPEEIVGRELAHELARLSRELKRQIGLLVNRRGEVTHVIVGDFGRIVLPDLKRFRVSQSRLRGLRLLHTHLKNEPLSDEDLTDMLLLRLDLVGVIQILPEGGAASLEVAHINPAAATLHTDKLQQALARGIEAHCSRSRFSIWSPQPNFLQMMEAIEQELWTREADEKEGVGRERAIIVHMANRREGFSSEILEEMKLLARSTGVELVDVVTQQAHRASSASFLGKGKMTDLCMQALSQGVGILLFSCDLSPSQVNHLGKMTDLKIVDRTQLILDIFARRANSRDGKLQVELAQMKYMLPRLVKQDHAMSRLMGGIGGRGPGETKLEIDRRRARERISRLEKEIRRLSTLRGRKRALRRKRGIPVIGLVGYTNVGKTTLFNRLARSDAFIEDAAFATLDPTSRKIRLPGGGSVILLDTVGFIRDLPPDLITAFRATLEEIQEANLILHVMDVSHEDLVYQMESVDRLLVEMGCETIPQIRVLNKMDLVSRLETKGIAKRLDAVSLCALEKETFAPLLERIQSNLATPAKHPHPRR